MRVDKSGAILMLMMTSLVGSMVSLLPQNVLAQNISSPLSINIGPFKSKNVSALSVTLTSYTVKPNAKFNVSGTLSAWSGDSPFHLVKKPVSNAQVNVRLLPVTLGGIQGSVVNTNTDSTGRFSATLTAPSRGGLAGVTAVYDGNADNYGIISVPLIITIR